MTNLDLQSLAYGFAAGICLSLLVLLSGWWKRRHLHAELNKLRAHLHTHMEISQEGAGKLRRDLEELRQRNENLRISLHTWQQKPGRAEQKNLQIYDRAVRSLLATTPGFGPAWEAALTRAEQEVAAADQGLLAFAKRLVLPSRPALGEIPRGQGSEAGRDDD